MLGLELELLHHKPVGTLDKTSNVFARVRVGVRVRVRVKHTCEYTPRKESDVLDIQVNPFMFLPVWVMANEVTGWQNWYLVSYCTIRMLHVRDMAYGGKVLLPCWISVTLYSQ